MPRKILIVDDEAFVLRVTELSLKKGGYTLIFGRDGREAVKLAGDERPALIIMDVQMPEMDGLTALRLLKQNSATASIPVIMLTARGHVLTRQDAEGSGAALFLTKPCSPMQLLKEVQRILGGAETDPGPHRGANAATTP
jgi:CheY-like chemotaxis protein